MEHITICSAVFLEDKQHGWLSFGADADGESLLRHLIESAVDNNRFVARQRLSFRGTFNIFDENFDKEKLKEAIERKLEELLEPAHGECLVGIAPGVRFVLRHANEVLQQHVPKSVDEGHECVISLFEMSETEKDIENGPDVQQLLDILKRTSPARLTSALALISSDEERRELSTLFSTVASQIPQVDLAGASAKLLIQLKANLKVAITHRAQKDLFDVALGETVTVQQVNKFLIKNAGKILKTHEKDQLAKIIQELMKSKGVELWRELDGWDYPCTITTTGRSDASTRRFVLKSIGQKSKLKSSSVSAIPNDLRLISPK